MMVLRGQNLILIAFIHELFESFSSCEMTVTLMIVDITMAILAERMWILRDGWLC